MCLLGQRWGGDTVQGWHLLEVPWTVLSEKPHCPSCHCPGPARVLTKHQNPQAGFPRTSPWHAGCLAGTLGRRAPAASLPAFLEGSEDTGARPRPGSLVACGTARGLLRAGQSCWAWPSACLRPGLGGGPCTPRGPGMGRVCAGVASAEPSACPASPVHTDGALCPGRGLAGPSRAGPMPLAPCFVAWPAAPCPQPPDPQPCLLLREGMWGMDRLPVQVSPAGESLLPQGRA